MTGGPPGSSWDGTSAGSPRDAGFTRSRHLRALLHGRGFLYGLVLGTVLAVVAGAALHSVVALVGGPVAVGLAAVLLALASAGRRSEQDFFREYAASHGFAYIGDMALMPLTPLLGAGDRRSCEHWMQGRLESGPGCGLGHYTYKVRDHDSRGPVKRRETRHFTICVVDLEAGMRCCSRSIRSSPASSTGPERS